ncbi:MAG TPA: DedA family protein [Candidatus Saccharimonadales bacterium]
MTELLAAILSTLDQLPFGWLLLAVFVFMTFETSLLIGLFIPGDIAVLAAGAATTSWQETVLLAIVAGFGALAGQSGGYFIGRMVGSRIRSSFLQRWITDEHWQQAEKLLIRGAGPGILAAQFLPFVHATLPVVAGVIKLQYRRFGVWAGIGSMIWALVYVGAGAIFGQVARADPSKMGWITLLALTLVVALWLIGYAIDRVFLRSRRKQPVSKPD